MLRRLSGSIEKFIYGNKNEEKENKKLLTNSSDKKLKCSNSKTNEGRDRECDHYDDNNDGYNGDYTDYSDYCSDDLELEDEETYGSRLRKSKGHWNLCTEISTSETSKFSDLSDNLSDLKNFNVSSSEIPSDLSINEEDWTDFVIYNQQLSEIECTNIVISNTEEEDAAYWNEYFKSLRLRELKGNKLDKKEIFGKHFDLNGVMRAKLINWIFEVALHYKLQRETVYLTQIILDSFLFTTPTPLFRTKLQLLALSALLISSKLEEVRPPNLTDLSTICDGMFKEKEIAAMELEICATLKWNLTPLNTLNWLNFYMKHLENGYGDGDDNNNDDDYYFKFKDSCLRKLDYLMHSSEFLNFIPSKLSAALLFTENMNDLLVSKCTGYSIKDLSIEIDWINSWTLTSFVGSIAFVDPKKLIKLTDSEFDEIIKNHRIALEFIIKRIKGLEQ